MAKHIEDEVVYYYDIYPTEEDLMGESSIHADLVLYLVLVLRWLFRGQQCAVYENLNFYQTRNRHEYPLAPDIAVIKGVDFVDVPSWQVERTGSTPQVVFEIASKETWGKDLKEKPLKYARMGVQEYFAYDPNDPPFNRDSASRLSGWQLDPAQGEMRQMPLLSDGRLWSVHLDSFLVPDGKLLRLYDRQGHLRLTGYEAEAQHAEAEARRAEAAMRQAETETKRAETEARRAKAEARRAEAATRQAEAEARRVEAAMRQAEAEARRAEALAEKLRSLGIDPDQL